MEDARSVPVLQVNCAFCWNAYDEGVGRFLLKLLVFEFLENGNSLHHVLWIGVFTTSYSV